MPLRRPRACRLRFESLEKRNLLATFVVNTLSDAPLSQSIGDGFLSLREALEAANTNKSVDGSPAGEADDFFARLDKITFAPSLAGTITLQAGELVVTSNVDIIGPGATKLLIDGDHKSRILNISGSNTQFGSLYVYDCTLINGTASLANSDGFGGAIRAAGSLVLTRVNITGSFAELDGGAIYSKQTSAWNSSISNNTAGRNGGGVYTFGWDLLYNSTLANNSAVRGGGLYSNGTVPLDLLNVTIAGNFASEAGGGIYHDRTSRPTHSIIAGNRSASLAVSDVAGTVGIDLTNGGFGTPYSEYNLIGEGGNGGLVNGTNGNKVGIDWKLALENNGLIPTLKLNGGETPTIALLPNSPAVDAGKPNFVPGAPVMQNDQRGVGFPRIVNSLNTGNAQIDIGAYELDSNVRIRLSGATASEASGTVTYSVTISRALPVGTTLSVLFATITTGTATTGADYTSLSQFIQFDSTSPLTKLVTVQITDDSIVEENESIVANLLNPTNGVIEFGFDSAVSTITDNEQPGIALNKTTATVSEDGKIVDSFTVVLTAIPSANVLINMSGGPRTIIDGVIATNLLFTPANWNVPRTVNLEGIDNNYVLDIVVKMRIAVANSAGGYRRAPAKELTVTQIDDDTRGIVVSKISGNTSESGKTATFSISLQSEPIFGLLTLPIQSSDTTEGTVSPSSILFSGSDWNIPRVITVTGVDDSEKDGNVPYSIIIGAATGGSDYEGIDMPDVPLLNIDDESASYDFGDAPTAAQSGFAGSYPTTLANNGARHLTGDLYLGNSVDTEFEGLPEAKAGQLTGGDDGDGTDDENGVVTIASLIASPTTATRSSFSITAHSAGKLDAWIDFNQDGDWSDANEQIFTNTVVSNGLNLLSFTIPAGALAGNTFGRFRLSTAGNLSPTGEASDGEIEDYLLNILPSQAGTNAQISLPSAATVDISIETQNVIVRLGNQELFQAPSIGLTLDLTGSAGNDQFNLVGDSSVAFGSFLKLDGAVGNDTVRLVGSGIVYDLTTATDGMKNIEVIDVTGSGANTLRLTASNVASGVPLRVKHDQGDTISYGTGWTMGDPQFVGSTFVHNISQGTANIQIENTRRYNNPLLGVDVNHKDAVSPIDALLVINGLNHGLARALSAPTGTGTLSSFAYLDASGDNVLSPLDALLVINYINRASSGTGEGESLSPQSASAVPQDLNESGWFINTRKRKSNDLSADDVDAVIESWGE